MISKGNKYLFVLGEKEGKVLHVGGRKSSTNKKMVAATFRLRKEVRVAAASKLRK